MKHFFYFDLDNMDIIFLKSVVGLVFSEKKPEDVFFKFYSSNMKNSFFEKSGFINKDVDFVFSVFDAEGKKVFGKEAVDRVVSMDVMRDLACNSPLSVNFVSNDYDFYGTLLLLERFFEKNISKSFVFGSENLKIPSIKSEISFVKIGICNKKNDLRKALVDEVNRLGLKFNGYNSTDIYLDLLKNGIDVKDYIGNSSLSLFMKNEFPPKTKGSSEMGLGG